MSTATFGQNHDPELERLYFPGQCLMKMPDESIIDIDIHWPVKSGEIQKVYSNWWDKV